MNFENTVSRFRKVSEHIAELAKVREDAAASFAAYLALANARRIARASDWLTHVPRPRLAAFLAFALVAMIHAQKSGTNAPPRGSVAGSVECRVGNVELNGGGAGRTRTYSALARRRLVYMAYTKRMEGRRRCRRDEYILQHGPAV